ncbi:DUF3592 domain-containing protein [Calothrix sp. UHCC 0171]|uniref:DUF3592 domain-containing protein n=1 Tax=Calothrix sp. UHCC 0171 TaxID=3110245 RepID=UPI002B212884|nr:DUF3592 domain-containing protein [Calothrix sp. UHCC 0171]MEA5573336.1 DUF3592 domain-containing protein [Calothrix sp. UHCC 0171]
MKKDDLMFFRLFTSLFIGIGSVFAIAGIIIGVNINSHIRNSLITQGTVIDYVQYTYKDEDGISVTNYHPIVQYTPINEEPLVFEDASSSNPPAYKKGQKVEVIYNPKLIEVASIHSRFNSWFLPSIFTGIGTILILIGLIPLLRRFLRRN